MSECVRICLAREDPSTIYFLPARHCYPRAKYQTQWGRVLRYRAMAYYFGMFERPRRTNHPPAQLWWWEAQSVYQETTCIRVP